MNEQDLPQITSYTTGTTTSIVYDSNVHNTGLISVPAVHYGPSYLGPANPQLNLKFISQQEDSEMSDTKRRLVQIFIIDPDENVPVEKALLHKDKEPRLTDATDQELYFELDLTSILTRHNQERIIFLDKQATREAGRDVHLEPARIRDLKMIVTTVAAC